MFKVDNFISFHDLTPAANFLWASSSITTCLGYEPEEIVGIAAYTVIHPDDAEYVKVTHQENVLNEMVGTQLALRYKHKDGTWVPHMVFFSLCYDYIVSCATLIEQTEGPIRQLSSHSAAMTSLVGSQEEEFERIRRHHEAFYADTWNANILDPEPRVCMILNRFSRSLGIMYASPSCQLIFQVEPDLMIGKSFLLYIRADDLASFVEQVDLAKSSNVVTHMRFWFQSPSCMDEIPCEAMLFGAADGMIAILRKCQPFVRKRLIVSGDFGPHQRTSGISRYYPVRSRRRNDANNSSRNSSSSNRQRGSQSGRYSSTERHPSYASYTTSSPSVSPGSSAYSSFISSASEAASSAAAQSTYSYVSQGSMASFASVSKSPPSFAPSFSSPAATIDSASLPQNRVSTESSPAQSLSSTSTSLSASLSSTAMSSVPTITSTSATGTHSYRAPLRGIPIGSINSIMNLDRDHNRIRPLRSFHRDESDAVDSSTPLPTGYRLRKHHIQESDMEDSSFFPQQHQQQQQQRQSGSLRESLGSHPYKQSSSPQLREQSHLQRQIPQYQQQHQPSSLYHSPPSHGLVHCEEDDLYYEHEGGVQNHVSKHSYILEDEQLAEELMELELDDPETGPDIVM